VSCLLFFIFRTRDATQLHTLKFFTHTKCLPLLLQGLLFQDQLPAKRYVSLLLRRVREVDCFQAAAALAAFSIESPKRPALKIIDENLPEAPKPTDAPTVEDDDPLDIPRKYVGDLDLPESEEPLLKESRRRFVLFPIQYHEVCRL